MFIVGLTGGISTGKSTVSQMFKDLGCPIVDADVIAREGNQFAILDTPLLFESNKMVPYMAFTIVVSCTPEQQLSRLQARNQLSEEEALQRINSQMSLDEKCCLATFVIDNSGDIENTKKQVLEIYRKLSNSRRHWKLRIAIFSVIIVFVSVIGYLIVR